MHIISLHSSEFPFKRAFFCTLGFYKVLSFLFCYRNIIVVTCAILCFTDELSLPSVFPLVTCKETGDQVTIGCLAQDFSPDSVTFQWNSNSGVSAVQYPSLLKGNKYIAVSLLQVPKSQWMSGVSFNCSVNHNGTIRPPVSIRKKWTTTPPPAVTTSVSTAGGKPDVTVHVIPEADINERPGEVTMVCLVSSPLQQNYTISWLESTGQNAGIYKSGADFGPVQTSGRYLVSSVYSTTKEKWRTHTFECNVQSRGSNRFKVRRAVSRDQLNAIECGR